MSTRKLITISVPPPLLKRAEQVAREENRTKSELLREALRFYVDTREVRKAGLRERVGALIEEIIAVKNLQTPSQGKPSRGVRRRGEERDRQVVDAGDDETNPLVFRQAHGVERLEHAVLENRFDRMISRHL